MKHGPADPTRRRGLAAALLGWPAWGAVGADTPNAIDLTWRDSQRERDVPLRLRLPPTPGPWPLVLYSHGLGGSRAGGAAWSQAWRRAGIAVLHLQHPGSDIETLREGLGALRAAADARQLLARIDDVRFVLDELLRRQHDGEAPWRDVRLDRVGLAGHSFGARTTQALAGERFAQGFQVDEPRLAAFIALSPSGGRLPVREAFAAVHRPFLGITGTHDGDPFGSFDGGEPRARVYDGLPPSVDGRRALLWIAGADHMSFGGGTGLETGLGARRAATLLRRTPAAVANEAEHQTRVAQVSTWWWQCWLLGDADARLRLRRLAGSADATHSAGPATADPLLGRGDRFTLG